MLRATRPPLSSPPEQAPCKGAALGKPLPFPLVFSYGEGNFVPAPDPGAAAAGAEGRAGPSSFLRPRPPRVRPTPLTGGDPRPCRVAQEAFCRQCDGRIMSPRSPGAPSSAGAQPLALASRAAGPGTSGGVWPPRCPQTVAAAELKTKRRHPKQSSGDAQRLSPCSGVLRCHGACRAGRRFGSREGEGNRPCFEQQSFFLALTGAADWAPCGGSPARVGELRAFIPPILVPRSLLRARSSPPFPRAAETSGGPGAQVSRQPRAGQTLSASPEHGGPVPCPRCRHVGR